MPTAVKAGLVALWLLSFGGMLGTFIQVGHNIGKEVTKLEKKQNTRNGIYLPNYAWNVLERWGWTPEQFEGIQQWIEDWGIRPDGEELKTTSFPPRAL